MLFQLSWSFFIYFIFGPRPFYSRMLSSRFQGISTFSHTVFGLPSANIFFEYCALQKATSWLYLVISSEISWYYFPGGDILRKPAFCSPQTRGLFLSQSRTADWRAYLWRAGANEIKSVILEKRKEEPAEARATPCSLLCLFHPFY